MGELQVFIEKAGERERGSNGEGKGQVVCMLARNCVCLSTQSPDCLFSLYSVSVSGVGCTKSVKENPIHATAGTHTHRQTVMALISDGSVSPHKKVLLCTFSEFIWSSSATRSEFFLSFQEGF